MTTGAQTVKFFAKSEFFDFKVFGALGPRDPGALGPRDPGAQGPWGPGPRDPGAQGPWGPGALGPRDPGAQGPWGPGLISFFAHRAGHLFLRGNSIHN